MSTYLDSTLQPDLGRFDTTQQEVLLADRYTRIKPVAGASDADSHEVLLTVGGQTFTIGGCLYTKEESDWFCWMLAKSLAGILKLEVETMCAGIGEQLERETKARPEVPS